MLEARHSEELGRHGGPGVHGVGACPAHRFGGKDAQAYAEQWTLKTGIRTTGAYQLVLLRAETGCDRRRILCDMIWYRSAVQSCARSPGASVHRGTDSDRRNGSGDAGDHATRAAQARDYLGATSIGESGDPIKRASHALRGYLRVSGHPRLNRSVTGDTLRTEPSVIKSQLRDQK